jgi:hypothetical protein
MPEPDAKVTEYKTAVVKFDNGFGALLCNGCSKVVKTGFDHPDVASYCCDACKPPPDPPKWWATHEDSYGMFCGWTDHGGGFWSRPVDLTIQETSP